MTDVREILDRALLPGTPPMTITRESAIDAGRRARRRRRAWAATTSAVVVLMIVAGSTVLRQIDDSSILPAEPLTPPTEVTITVSPDPPTSIGPTATASPFPPAERPLTEPTATALARLTALTQTWSARYLRGFTTGSKEAGPPLTFAMESRIFHAHTTLTDANGTGQIGIELYPRGRFEPFEFNTICRNQYDVLTCETRIGPHGEHIVIRRTRVFRPDGRLLSVGVLKPDGTEIGVTTANSPPGPSAGNPRAEPPLDPEQLLALALDPAFTLYPAIPR